MVQRSFEASYSTSDFIALLGGDLGAETDLFVEPRYELGQKVLVVLLLPLPATWGEQELQPSSRGREIG